MLHFGKYLMTIVFMLGGEIQLLFTFFFIVIMFEFLTTSKCYCYWKALLHYREPISKTKPPLAACGDRPIRVRERPNSRVLCPWPAPARCLRVGRKRMLKSA